MWKAPKLIARYEIVTSTFYQIQSRDGKQLADVSGRVFFLMKILGSAQESAQRLDP
jgi:hypothetical protein